MKLSEVRTREVIDWPGVGGGNATHMTTAQGFAIEMEQGVVTITNHRGLTRMVPMSNVVFVVPVKPGKPAA